MKSSAKRLLLIDGHSLAYRAFFALPVENFSNSKGQATNVIYGFGSMLVNLIASEKPTHIAVAFDVSRKTFRSEIFPSYKATRSATPDEFRSQMSYLEELVTDLGIKRFAVEGFEADDILATLSTQATAQGFEVLISTGDRDSFQLVNDQITILYPKRGVGELARMNPAAVFEKYGLTPTQYPDFAALRGDPSDNLPSVPGVGEKTATKWIVEYGSLQALLDHSAEISGKVGENLRAHIQEIKLNRKLTALIHDVALDAQVDELEWRGPDLTKIDHLLAELEIKALKEKIHALAASVGVTGDKQAEAASPLITEQVVAVTELSVSELKKLLAGRIEPIALYSEAPLTQGPIAIALGADQIYLLNAGAPEWLLDSKIPKLLHRAKAILRYTQLAQVHFDTELAAYLLNPGGRNLELGDLAERFLGRSVTESGDDLFSSFNAAYAGIIFELVPLLRQELADRELIELLENLEMPAMFALSELERAGVAVAAEKLASLSSFFTSEVAAETELAYAVVGHEFNVASPKQLQVVLFDELGLPKTKKIKTGYTTDAESLETLFAKTQNPLLNHLLRIRETSKLLTTVDGLTSAIAADGRIHTTFQQTVTATGRLSSTDPNLQNIPVRTEEGRRIRDCFIAQKPFGALLTADYSQIEMRIMAHLSQDAGLIQAFKTGEDLHSTVAAQVFGVQASEVDPEMRRQIKAMSYGLAYGLSAFGLSQQLNLSPGEASALMEQYFQRFGGIQDYLKTVVVRAREKGYTETILGRRRYLPDLTSDNRARREVAERMALNAPIQGSAADIIKVAMLHVLGEMKKAEVKSRLLLQVHDELIFEVYPGEEELLTAMVKAQMEGAIELSLPLAVNVGLGTSWDLAAH
jgi:DNA polymerase-1